MHIKSFFFIALSCLPLTALAEYYSAYTNPAIFDCDDCGSSFPAGRNVVWVPGYFDNRFGWVSPHWQSVSSTDIAFYNQTVDCVHATIKSDNYRGIHADGYDESTYSYSDRHEYEGISNIVEMNNEGIIESNFEAPEISLDMRTGDDIGDDLQIN